MAMGVNLYEMKRLSSGVAAVRMTTLNKDMFREAGIRLEYKAYDYESYPQL